MDFETWWQETYANAFKGQPGIMEQAWKEMAQAGFNAGLKAAVEFAEPPNFGELKMNIDAKIGGEWTK